MRHETNDPPFIGANLRRKRDRLRGLLAGPVDTRGRYAIGETIAEIKGQRDKYGAGAVALLAAWLKEDVPSLYRYATVAECWTEKQFEALLQRSGPGGRQLSWSHLVLIAGVSSPAERRRWAERTLEDGLSVRELAVLVTAANAEGPRPGRGAVASLGRLARSSERWVGALEATVGATLARVASAPLEHGDLHAALERVVSAHERLHATSERQLQRLQAELGRRRLSRGM